MSYVILCEIEMIMGNAHLAWQVICFRERKRPNVDLQSRKPTRATAASNTDLHSWIWSLHGFLDLLKHTKSWKLLTDRLDRRVEAFDW